MIAAGRREAVLRELTLRGALAVTELAPRLGVSEVTLRRDLRELERAGRLRRVHGGAVSAASPAGPPVATIGMIVPTRGYYYAETIAGARAAAGLANVRLVLAITEYEPAEEARLLRRMLALRPDGLLVTPTDVAALAEAIEAGPIPVTVLERDWDRPTGARAVDCVRTDHAHGAGLAVAHLAALGHTRLGLWSRANAHEDALRRGFVAAVAEHGLSAPALAADDVPGVLRAALAAGVTGLIVHPDEHALALVGLAADHGVDVPGDLSVIAYDDEIAALGELPLTAVAPPKRALGSVALETCLRAVAHTHPAATPHPAQRLRLLPELRVRESSGPAPAGGAP